MKYLRQLGIILTFSFLGELCSAVIPFRLPASIYGMVLLVIALLLKIVKFEWVRETGAFLSGLLPLLFIVPIVGLLDHWDAVKGDTLAIALIIVVTAVATFALSGIVTQKIMDRKERTDERTAAK